MKGKKILKGTVKQQIGTEKLLPIDRGDIHGAPGERSSRGLLAGEAGPVARAPGTSSPPSSSACTSCGLSLATFGLPGGDPPRWCAACPGRPAGAVEEASGTCACGKGLPVFGLPGAMGARGLWCAACPGRDPLAVFMVQTERMCECGAAKPIFGKTEDGTKRWCAACPARETGSVNLVYRRCICGRSQANYGLPGEGKRRWCARCPDKPAAAVPGVRASAVKRKRADTSRSASVTVESRHEGPAAAATAPAAVVVAGSTGGAGLGQALVPWPAVAAATVAAGALRPPGGRVQVAMEALAGLAGGGGGVGERAGEGLTLDLSLALPGHGILPLAGVRPAPLSTHQREVAWKRSLPPGPEIELVGRAVLRLFVDPNDPRRTTWYRGRVQGLRMLADGGTVWRVLYDDGDSEELRKEDIEKGIAAAEGTGGGAENVKRE